MRICLLCLLLICSQFSYSTILSVKLQDDLTEKKDTDTIPDPGIAMRAKKNGDKQHAKGIDVDEGDTHHVLEPLLSYNFSGGNKGFSGLTPVIQYGFRKHVWKKLSLSLQPYAAGQIDVRDSSTFIPALMLPGIAGIKFNSYITWGNEDVSFVWAPINLGIKLITNYSDSNRTIVQHNVRTGIGFIYQGWFQVGAQFTYGWHNTTSESVSNFKEIFLKNSSDIKYLTITLETHLNKESESESTLFAEWRGLLGKKAYADLPNTKILTIGFRKDLDLDNIFPASRGAQ